jgi:nucleotide-binding universal stress UspA family protein
LVEVTEMSATTALLTLAAIWAGVGLLVALVMGRHGHDPFVWWLLGTTLGPLVVPLVVAAEHRRADRALLVRAGMPGQGPVDVLAGVDGSPEAAAALATALDLLGPRLGRLALAAVTDMDASVEHDRQQARAHAELERQAETVRAWLSTQPSGPDENGPRIPELLLAGRRGAAAPGRGARLHLLVVGTRGAGLSKVLLGSTATALAAHAKLPVLLAGGGGGPSA